MATLHELTHFLDQFLDVSNFVDYCANGIQIEGKESIQSIATAVSANLETIEAAISKGADALVVHHGMFWNKDLENLRIEGTRKKKIELLLKHNLSLLAYHLPLDAHSEVGNNWKAAKDLGWNNLNPFGLYNKNYIGVKGTFPPISVEHFQKQMEAYYGHPAHAALGGKETVTSAALISGGAYRELPQAKKAEVDCFVTGNFDEPAWATAHEEHIHFFALGHNATEKVGPKALAKKLSEVFKISAFFLDVYNPF